MNLRQHATNIHSLAKFISEIQECRRILAVAPDSLVLTPRMLEIQLKTGLNARCRLYLSRIDFSIGDIEHWLYQLTVFENEWLNENRHALPGAMVASTGHVAASSASADDALATSCSYCDASNHCVDKCTRRAKLLAQGKAELHAARHASSQGRKNEAKSKAGSGAGAGAKPAKQKKGGARESKPNDQAKKSSDRPCFDFQKGACTRGEACKYKHVKVAASGNASAAASVEVDNDGAPIHSSPAATLAIAQMMEMAAGNKGLQKAIRDRVDEGWTNAARYGSLPESHTTRFGSPQQGKHGAVSILHGAEGWVQVSGSPSQYSSYNAPLGPFYMAG
jgi:hypothetical protein